MPAVLTQKREKIFDLVDLPARLADYRIRGKKIVHCHGVFDLLHVGHIHHLEEARKHGDVLVVTITPDKWVNKGPHRPAFPQEHRLRALAALECVDFVAINQWPTAIETIRLLRPDFFAKGGEFKGHQDVTGAVAKEAETVSASGGEMVFTNEDVVFSSSALINRHLPQISDEASQYVAECAKKYKIEDVLRYFEKASKLKVLVVGETIIDEYHYCQTLGKSGKEPILAVRHLSTEKFAGGNLAVVNHVASFAEKVELLTYLGANSPQEEFVRSGLNNKAKATFIHQEGAPTIVKERYIENYPFQKMFEVYRMNDCPNDSKAAFEFYRRLDEMVPEFDLVIVTDYGHGMLDEIAVAILARRARCLAVNTQMNAGNHGFNTVSKYPRADYVCVSENEIRLEARKRRDDLNNIVTQVAERMSCRNVMVTRGQQGMLCYDRKHGFASSPAMVSHFKDRVGAGDAVFAVTSLCMACNAPAELLALVGNAVGSLAVAIVGNREAVDKTALVRTLVSLFK